MVDKTQERVKEVDDREIENEFMTQSSSAKGDLFGLRFGKETKKKANDTA